MPNSGNFVESKELFFTISLLIIAANFPSEFLLCEKFSGNIACSY